MPQTYTLRRREQIRFDETPEETKLWEEVYRDVLSNPVESPEDRLEQWETARQLANWAVELHRERNK